MKNDKNFSRTNCYSNFTCKYTMYIPYYCTATCFAPPTTLCYPIDCCIDSIESGKIIAPYCSYIEVLHMYIVMVN